MDNIINNCVRKIINFLYNHFFKNTNIFYFYQNNTIKDCSKKIREILNEIISFISQLNLLKIKYNTPLACEILDVCQGVDTYLGFGNL